MAEKEKKFFNIPIADKVDGVYKWRDGGDCVNIDSFRVTYYSKKQTKRFFEENSILYVRMVSRKYVLSLLDAALKIAGSKYVLALVLNNGNRDRKTLNPWYVHFMRRTYSHYEVKMKHLKAFEKFIKHSGIACGVVDDGIKWINYYHLDLKIQTLKNYYANDKSDFIVLDRVLYYLAPRRSLIENIFMKCVALAGSEWHLAKATSNNSPKIFRKHIKAFERMSFKQGSSFTYYINVFEKFLEKNTQLFDSSVSV